MLGPPADGPILWLGLVLASAAALGAALSLPTAPPPDADALAATIDEVAVAPANATVHRDLDATAVRVGADSVALRGPGGVSRSRLRFGPVVPVDGDDALVVLLWGSAPGAVFDVPADLEKATARAMERPPAWREWAGLTVRTILWGDVRVTLVGP